MGRESGAEGRPNPFREGEERGVGGLERGVGGWGCVAEWPKPFREDGGRIGDPAEEAHCLEV
jgi:hypothetical protein